MDSIDPVFDDRRDAQTYLVIGAAMEVHRQLGHGFLESVYQAALAMELVDRQIPFQREVDLPVRYKGKVLACTFRADFVCYESVIVELKAIQELTTRDHSQVLNYLKATGLSRALLFNFGAPRLEYQRIVLSSHLRPSASSADKSLPLPLSQSSFSADQSSSLSPERSPRPSMDHSEDQPVHVEVSGG